MNKIQNPMRIGHRASQSTPAVSAGAIPDEDSTTIDVGGRVVGVVRDGVFLKKVKGSRHFLKHPPAISFDLESLNQAQEAGARTVTVIDTETNKEYKAFISTILSMGFELNRGHGRQKALSLSLWSTQNQPPVEQLRLWE